jgi:hypothetical protein
MRGRRVDEWGELNEERCHDLKRGQSAHPRRLTSHDTIMLKRGISSRSSMERNRPLPARESRSGFRGGGRWLL